MLLKHEKPKDEQKPILVLLFKPSKIYGSALIKQLDAKDKSLIGLGVSGKFM